MKSFLAINTYTNSTYGQNVTQKIYRIKNNTLVYLGVHLFNTQSMKGEIHEALNWIVENKYLPKSCLTKSGYINRDELNITFKLKSI